MRGEPAEEIFLNFEKMLLSPILPDTKTGKCHSCGSQANVPTVSSWASCFHLTVYQFPHLYNVDDKKLSYTISRGLTVTYTMHLEQCKSTYCDTVDQGPR